MSPFLPPESPRAFAFKWRALFNTGISMLGTLPFQGRGARWGVPSGLHLGGGSAVEFWPVAAPCLLTDAQALSLHTFP
eukprot:218839-Chlamydomonas_euryale.AAC.12